MTNLPYSCPLFQGERFADGVCEITGKPVSSGNCCNILYSYLSCEHFSGWFWEKAKRKRRLPKEARQ